MQDLKPNANAILFDLDNTLVPYVEPVRRWARAWANAASDDPRAVEKALVDETLEGRAHPTAATDAAAEQFGLHGVKHEATDAARQTYWNAVNPYPGVRSALDQLDGSDVKLGVVTDAPRERAAVRLAASQLTDRFDVVVAYDDTPRGKEGPEPFDRALEQLGEPPRKAVMVGDWPAYDVRWPNRLGMRTVLAQWCQAEIPACGQAETDPWVTAEQPRELVTALVPDSTASTCLETSRHHPARSPA